jgi:tellurite resistance protein TehA-like permease
MDTRAYKIVALYLPLDHFISMVLVFPELSRAFVGLLLWNTELGWILIVISTLFIRLMIAYRFWQAQTLKKPWLALSLALCAIFLQITAFISYPLFFRGNSFPVVSAFLAWAGEILIWGLLFMLLIQEHSTHRKKRSPHSRDRRVLDSD